PQISCHLSLHHAQDGTGGPGTGDYVCADEACFVQRSYSFLDGLGRVREQHAVAPDGSGGRVVTATRYDELGRTAWTSAPFFNEDPAQFASGLVNPVFADMPAYTTYEYDVRGRTVAQSLESFGTETVSTTSYEFDGPSTRVTGPSGAVTETLS